MLNFQSFLTEQAGKNMHMEHLEELIFNDGVDGARNAINFLRDIRDMLAGHTTSANNITVKFDGAPAIFAGIDPYDGKFFVAKKGIFNKNPLLYKSLAEIRNDPKLHAELKKSFATAFTEFSKFGIKKGVYQGDLMFVKADVNKEDIDGESYYTFQPNTIVYAVPVASALGKKIRRAKIGVVWHTTYTGNSIDTMSASFGKAIVPKFKQTSTVWMDDANYKDVSGSATFTASETAKITKILSDSGKALQGIDGSVLRLIQNDEELKGKIKTYNNTFVRAGEAFPDPKAHVRGLMEYVAAWYDKEIDKRKSDKGKQTQRVKRDEALKQVFGNVTELTNIFKLMNLLIEAKQMIVDKLNQAGGLKTLLRTKSGFKPTSQEGYVAIDHVKGAVKLVDRLEFSLANFSPDIIKGWDR